MAEKQADETKARERSTKKIDQEGLARIDLELDYKTYTCLLALVEKSGYQLSKSSREKSQGIRGVLTQGVIELYQKYIEENKVIADEEEHSQMGLNKFDQQVYIFANRAQAMKKNEINHAEIVSTFQEKLPDYLRTNKKKFVSRIAAKNDMEKFIEAGRLLSPRRPKLTPGMIEDLEKRKLLKFLNTSTKDN